MLQIVLQKSSSHQVFGLNSLTELIRRFVSYNDAFQQVKLQAVHCFIHSPACITLNCLQYTQLALKHLNIVVV
jgi:hypothetical protein